MLKSSQVVIRNLKTSTKRASGAKHHETGGYPTCLSWEPRGPVTRWAPGLGFFRDKFEANPRRAMESLSKRC